MKNEPMVKFRNRYMEAIVQLREYGWVFSDEQIMADVQTRVRDWATLATHKPTNLQELLLAASSLEGLAQGPAAHVPTSSQILLVNGFDTYGDHDSRIMPAQSFGGGTLAAGAGRVDMVGAPTRVEGTGQDVVMETMRPSRSVS